MRRTVLPGERPVSDWARNGSTSILPIDAAPDFRSLLYLDCLTNSGQAAGAASRADSTGYWLVES